MLLFDPITVVLVLVGILTIIACLTYIHFSFDHKKNNLTSSVFYEIHEEQVFDEYEPRIKDFLREMHIIDKDLFRHSNWKLMSKCPPVKASLLMFRHVFIEMVDKLWSPEIKNTKELRHALSISEGLDETTDLYLFMYSIVSDDKIVNAIKHNSADRYLVDYMCEQIDSASKRINYLSKSILLKIDGTRNRVRSTLSEEAMESFVKNELTYKAHPRRGN